LEHQKRELEKEREAIAQTEAEAEAEDSRLKELSELCEPETCEEADWMVLEGEFQMLMSRMEPHTLRSTFVPSQILNSTHNTHLPLQLGNLNAC
jgi:hypothetical protein